MIFAGRVEGILFIHFICSCEILVCVSFACAQADAREEAAGGGVKKATAMPRAKRRRVGSSSGLGARGRDGAEVPSARL